MNTDIRDRRLDRSRRQTRGASTGHLATTNSASKTRPFPRTGIRPAVLAVGAALFILLALQMLPSGTPPLHAQGSSGGNSAPEFGEDKYAFTVSEDASVGSAVGTVSASDPDAGDLLAYAIASGNEGGVFSMAVNTGGGITITVSKALDYETKRRYAFTVQVVDSGGGGTDTAKVSVEVTNVSDVCSAPGATAVTYPSTTNTALAGDCDVLLVAKDTLRGTGSLNWSTDTAIGSWDGVTVSGTPSRVTGLDLSSRSLTGSIPWELGSLSELTVLDLSGNSLTGEIPHELGRLGKLTNLNLGSNSLTGEIPHELGRLGKLTNLNLGSNSLTGEIPTQLGNLSNLRGLGLGRNSLTGEIPTQLGNLSKLWDLVLNENSLTGKIPPQLGSLSELENLNLSGNSLTGKIPPQLGNLSNLVQLWLMRNQLSGPLPSSLGNLGNLWMLNLKRNRLSGEIPGELGRLSRRLTHLLIHNNDFTGCYPAAWRSVPTKALHRGDLVWSSVLPYCNSAPVFVGSSEYVFTVSEDASVGSGVGAMSAIDVDVVDQPRLAYTIVSGDEGGVFSIGKHGMWLARTLDYEAKRRYALTVQVSDGRGGMDTAAVSVEVTNALDVCSETGATAVTNPSTTNTGLAGDCEVLLVAKDTLRGTGSLNWSTGTAIGSWDGVTVSGTPNRVTGLSLGSRSLTGSIPWELGSLSELTNLDLSGNSLTGSIPPELGLLSKLTSLSLRLIWVR